MIIDCKCPHCGGDLVLSMRSYKAPPEADNPYERVNAIIAEEAAASGFTAEELKGRTKSRAIVAARKVVIRRAVAEAGISLPKLGRMLGGRDHTTILHALRD